MNVFIDTNVFLSFYHFTNDDLEELKKLGVLLDRRRVWLFLPNQVVQEFRRNRETKIADALKRLRDQNLSFQFPQFCKDYPEYEQLRDLQKNYSRIHADLVKKVNDDVSSQNLRADSTIRELFDRSRSILIEDHIRERARARIEIGNPPGKGGSFGDAINWEALLSAVPEGEDIYFITDDKDYVSPVDRSAFNTFLLEEWTEAKNSTLIFYQSLSEFFREHFPEITLTSEASELEKYLLIWDLANSGSFARTHEVIAKLNRYIDFTVPQINEIVGAAISNNQVYWIIGDRDVKEFLLSIIKGKEDQIEPANLEKLFELLGSDDSESNDDILDFLL